VTGPSFRYSLERVRTVRDRRGWLGAQELARSMHRLAGIEAQLMTETASSPSVANAMDPAESVDGGASNVAGMMSQFRGNANEALAGYGAGLAATSRYREIRTYAETESYVTRVLGYAEAYRRAHPAAADNGVIA
jgi:soluble lytic murein transglycosylase-like protein